MAILLEPRQVMPTTASTNPLEPTLPSAFFNSPNESSDEKMSPGTLALAIVVPIVFIIGLACLGIFLRRRMKAARQINGQDSIPTPPNTAATTASTNTNTTSESRESRRDARRARRLRRTESGGTIKTLPEYNELGEDEILLSKSIEAPSSVLRHGSRGREASSQSRGESGDSVSRQSSLTAVFRRLSLRRSEPEPVTEDDSNEMEDMIERATLTSLNDDAIEQRMSPVREEQILPLDDTPEYNRLYPTLPPQIQVSNNDVESQTPPNGNANASRRTRGFRNMFRRQATSMDTTPRRNVGLSSSSGADLGLTLTMSNDNSLYRPSTSSSRSMAFGGSSISLLSQVGNESSDTLGRRSHLRNISAPISTRRLQLAPPIAGFSDQQMQFLTSVESLDKYGVPVDGILEEQQQVPPPPSFEELAREEERLEQQQQQPRRHIAPILTSAELVIQHERSPLSPTLPNRQSSFQASNSITIDNNDNNNGS